MALAAITLGMLALLALGYVLYGSYVARQYRLDDANTTPAVAKNDGIDFVPSRWFPLLAQHFSAIAAAGPIAGPIMACLAFGWLPCLLWIGIGVILIGAVHDFSALVASVRNGSTSIAEIARKNFGRRAYLALVAFIWLALVYVIVAFTQMTAQTFVGVSEELQGLGVTFNKGGAVAASSTLYLLLALTMGMVQRFLRPPIWLLTLLFVPSTLLCVWLGTRLDSVLVLDARSWFVIILGYCLIASMLPLWLLQQPRGYLGGFVLYLAIGVGLLGVLLGSFGGQLQIRQPMISDQALRTLHPLSALELADPKGSLAITGLVFPFLFVTIACGACSGFHGLICGGTTSKQIARESHCKHVGFGAMLLEGLVAVIALSTVMVLAPSESSGKGPARIYGDGLAGYLTMILGKDAFLFCATFGAMAFSTFVFDTLDVSTRLGRYLLQELFGARSLAAGLVASAVTASVPLLLLMLADPTSYQLFWTLFGTSNQLLASLTLLGVAVWLKRQGKRSWFVVAPMVFVMMITLWALVIQIGVGARDVWLGRWTLASASPAAASAGNVLVGINPTVINGGVAVALFGLALVFVREAMRGRAPDPDTPAAASA